MTTRSSETRQYWLIATLIALILAFAAGRSDAQDAPAHPNEHMAFFTAMPKAEYLFDVALLADMLTTNDIKNHAELRETNAMLGDNPSAGRIVGYAVVVATVHALVTYELVREDVPQPIITAWELVTIGIEVGYAAHNYSVGLRCRF